MIRTCRKWHEVQLDRSRSGTSRQLESQEVAPGGYDKKAMHLELINHE